MKILNIEHSELVAYVQQKNLKGILNNERDIPRSLIKIMRNLRLNSSEDKYDEEFIRIEDKDAIEYITSLPWIPDFRQLRDKTDNELQNQIKQEKQRIKEITDYYASLDREQQLENFELLNQKAKISLTLKDIKDYLLTRQKRTVQPLKIPYAIDSKELHTDITEINCTVGLSLDKTKILLQKIDGSPFRSTDTLPLSIIQPTIMMLGLESGLTTDNENQNLQYYLDPSQNFFIAEYNPRKTIDESVSTIPVETKQPQKKKSFFERFKSRKKDAE